MKGVQIVQETPFNKDGSLDLEGMRANTRWLVERTAGKDFIFTPMGSNGEFYAVSDDECKDVIKMVVEEVNGRNVVLPGAGRAGTLKTIKMCQYAESVGADGALIVLPYYQIPTEEGMYQHYKLVCEGVGKDFGIMLYNNPFTTGSWVKPPLMAKLSKIPNFIAVKECTPYVMSYYEMIKAVDPEDTVIICGSAEVMFSFEAMYGCPGFISAIANFAPELPYSIYEAAVARDFGKLAKLVDSPACFYSFAAKVEASHSPHTGVVGVSEAETMMLPTIHAAMDIVGLRGAECRLPLVGLSKEEKDELCSLLRTMGVIK